MNMARLIALAVSLLAATTAGCKKDVPLSVAATQTNATPSDSAAAPPPTPPVHGPGQMPAAPPGPPVVSDDGGVNAVLTQLSLELRKYVVRTRSIPKTYEEFAAKSNVQAPPPPAGKKYAIENQAIVLVGR
jgi:hypothetical protein